MSDPRNEVVGHMGNDSEVSEYYEGRRPPKPNLLQTAISAFVFIVALAISSWLFAGLVAFIVIGLILLVALFCAIIAFVDHWKQILVAFVLVALIFGALLVPDLTFLFE